MAEAGEDDVSFDQKAKFDLSSVSLSEQDKSILDKLLSPEDLQNLDKINSALIDLTNSDSSERIALRDGTLMNLSDNFAIRKYLLMVKFGVEIGDSGLQEFGNFVENLKSLYPNRMGGVIRLARNAIVFTKNEIGDFKSSQEAKLFFDQALLEESQFITNREKFAQTISDSISAVLESMQGNYPEQKAAIMSGGWVRGDATSISDIDLYVVNLGKTQDQIDNQETDLKRVWSTSLKAEIAKRAEKAGLIIPKLSRKKFAQADLFYYTFPSGDSVETKRLNWLSTKAHKILSTEPDLVNTLESAIAS